jgi:hypothetical protein
VLDAAWHEGKFPCTQIDTVVAKLDAHLAAPHQRTFRSCARDGAWEMQTVLRDVQFK